MGAPLLLASRSPRRQELLRRAGLDFELGPAPQTDEAVPPLDPGPAVEQLATEKGSAVAHLALDRIVLTADTLVFLDGAPLGKPIGAAAAAAMLRRLSGREHLVVTGVALTGPDGQGGLRRVVGHEVTRVRFRTLSDAEIDAYVATGEPLDKAGAYAIQGGARAFVAELRGPEDNVIGLPMELLRRLLATIS